MNNPELFDQRYLLPVGRIVRRQMIALHRPGPLDAFGQMEYSFLAELFIDPVYGLIQLVAPGGLGITEDILGSRHYNL